MVSLLTARRHKTPVFSTTLPDGTSVSPETVKAIQVAGSREHRDPGALNDAVTHAMSGLGYPLADLMNHGFGNLAPDSKQATVRNALGQIGASLLKNSTMRPGQALGTAVSDYMTQLPEQQYRAMQMQNATEEMNARRQKNARESNLWKIMESDTSAPEWARMSPDTYSAYQQSSASQAAATAIYSKFAPLFDQGGGAAPGNGNTAPAAPTADGSGSQVGTGYDPARLQQLYSLKAQAELAGNNNLAQAAGAEISRIQSGADLNYKQSDLEIKRQQADWQTGGEARNKQYLEMQNEGLKGQSSMAVYDKLDNLVQQPGFYSGWGNAQVTGAKRIAAALGWDANAVKDIESFKALANDAVRTEIGSLGTGVSNGDVAFMVNANANLDYSPAGNRQLVGIKRRLAQRKVEIAAFARKYKQVTGQKYLDEGFDQQLAQWAQDNPMFPEAQGGQGGQSGQGGQYNAAPSTNIPWKRID